MLQGYGDEEQIEERALDAPPHVRPPSGPPGRVPSARGPQRRRARVAEVRAERAAAVTLLDDVLGQEVATWPVGSAAVAVVDGSGTIAFHGSDAVFRWASVTKLLTALVVLDLVRDGTVELDEPAGPPGSTVRHLLAHASGLTAGSDKVLAPPGRRRIYSNHGYEVLAGHVEGRAGQPFDVLLRRRLLDPLGMRRTTLAGSPAHGAQGPVRDLCLLAHELLRPRHAPVDLLREATTTAFPGLSGVLPGFGRQDPNDWGLGFEVHDAKSPHWMAPECSPRAFGHFGQSGSFLWVDPDADLACAAACDTDFGPWAATAWPTLSTRVLEAHSRSR